MNWAPFILPHPPTLCTVLDSTYFLLILKHNKTNTEFEQNFNNGTKCLMSCRITEVCSPKDSWDGTAQKTLDMHPQTSKYLKAYMKKICLCYTLAHYRQHFIVFSITGQPSFNEYLVAVEKKNIYEIQGLWVGFITPNFRYLSSMHI